MVPEVLRKRYPSSSSRVVGQHSSLFHSAMGKARLGALPWEEVERLAVREAVSLDTWQHSGLQFQQLGFGQRTEGYWEYPMRLPFLIRAVALPLQVEVGWWAVSRCIGRRICPLWSRCATGTWRCWPKPSCNCRNTSPDLIRCPWVPPCGINDRCPLPGGPDNSCQATLAMAMTPIPRIRTGDSMRAQQRCLAGVLCCLLGAGRGLRTLSRTVACPCATASPTGKKMPTAVSVRPGMNGYRPRSSTSAPAGTAMCWGWITAMAWPMPCMWEARPTASATCGPTAACRIPTVSPSPWRCMCVGAGSKKAGP